MSIFKGRELIPELTLRRPIANIEREFGILFESDFDDLDYFRAHAFQLDEPETAEGFGFALMQYRGHENDTVTLYFPYGREDIRPTGIARDAGYQARLLSIMRELRVSPEEIVWSRLD
ncbi:hypothetical protein [Zavarzinia aquatilis]|uniref:Uncharacterized protein n=1 Tax=Zavarzinia aquatilis TaxID=2211142 RepID=A0A317EBK8_9PROT|nr:hypothetical protein [Zavarzinia aquatilis]PWR24458.1 hypothetical protein DKG74_06530 [Zavarzinia aquatilis]